LTCAIAQALNKYLMELWSNDFTAAFFVSFIVTVFAPDHIEAIQKNKYCEYVYELEQPVQ